MKILVLVDRLEWAYHRIALAIKKYNDSSIDIDIMHIKNNVNNIRKSYKKYDRFLVMGWQTYADVNFLPKVNTLIGIHGHHAWDNRKTTPERDVEPKEEFLEYLQSFRGVNVVSKRLNKLFPFSYYTPNGADTEIFYQTKPPFDSDMIKVGCAYSGDKHEWRKGVETYIVPAAKKAKAELVLAKRNVHFNDMRDYYNDIDIYICASSSEGMSLGVLEAMACGRPVISTWPSELPTYNVKRSVSALAEAIEFGQLKIPEFEYSWEKKVKAWIDFLKI